MPDTHNLFTPLIPQTIRDPQALQETFQEGISTGWPHILAGLDTVRSRHINAIAAGFKQHNIVIVHGASGQGKSALAYRYLHDTMDTGPCYEIRDLSAPDTALDAAAALADTHAALSLYIDAEYNASGLAEFLKKISRLTHIKCLVEISKALWRRMALSDADIQCSDLELNFNRQEAQDIYDAWAQKTQSPFSDFDQAWTKFPEGGSLLEFMYLLTHRQPLYEGLEKKCRWIMDENNGKGQAESDLQLLRYIAAAGVGGARIEASGFPENQAFFDSQSRIEKNYLLRRSDDKKYLLPLHPLHATLLTAILTDLTALPWSSVAMECMGLLADTDIAEFLLNTFLTHPESAEALIEYLEIAPCRTWTEAAGIADALLWKGSCEYVQENKQLLKQVYDKAGETWRILLDFNFEGELNTGTGAPDPDPDPDGLARIPEPGRKQAEHWRKQQTPKTRLFSRLDHWLQQITLPPIPKPENEKEWRAFQHMAYWIARQQPDHERNQYVSDNFVSLPGRIRINQTAYAVAGRLFRPGTWQNYCERIFTIRSQTVLCLDELRKNLIKHFRSKKVVQQVSELPNSPRWMECIQQLRSLPRLPLESLDYWGYTEESPESAADARFSEKTEKPILYHYLKKEQAYLKRKHAFFFGLGDFFSQSPDFIVAHSFLGRPKTHEQRLKIEQTLQKSALKLDQPWRPGFHLAKAQNALPGFQRYFRRHFSKFSDPEKLSRLEQEEAETLSALWCLWYFFASTPTRRMDIPGKIARTQLEQKTNAVCKSFKNAFQAASTQEIRFQWIGDALPFDEDSALWIIADGDNPLALYTQTESQLIQIKKSMDEISPHSLEYYALYFQWRHILIIPSCKGKLLEAKAWVIPATAFTDPTPTDTASGCFDLILRDIDKTIPERFGLKFWDPALFQDAKAFFQSAADMKMQLQHLLRPDNIPVVNENGQETAQGYFHALCKALQQRFQQMIDSARILLSLYPQADTRYLSPPAMAFLEAAIEYFISISDQLFPDDFENAQMLFQMDALNKWQPAIASIPHDFFIIYLLWCGYLMETDCSTE